MDECKVGYYGKLPFWPEFLRLNAAGPEVLAFDQWVQEGIHLASGEEGSSWQEDFEKVGPWNVLFCPSGSLSFLVGVCGASRDRAGRKFPFFLFLRVDRTAFTIPIWLGAVSFMPFLTQARELLQRGQSLRELQEFRNDVEKLAVPSLLAAQSSQQSYREYIQHKTAGEFWTSLFGEFASPKKSDIVYNLTESLKGVPPSQGLRWGLKFPLMSSAQKNEYDLPFWVDWVGRSLGGMSPTLLVWNREPQRGQPCLLAVFGRVSPRNFLFMSGPERTDDSWLDLGFSRVPVSASSTNQEALRRPEVPLAAYLNPLSAIG